MGSGMGLVKRQGGVLGLRVRLRRSRKSMPRQIKTKNRGRIARCGKPKRGGLRMKGGTGKEVSPEVG